MRSRRAGFRARPATGRADAARRTPAPPEAAARNHASDGDDGALGFTIEPLYPDRPPPRLRLSRRVLLSALSLASALALLLVGISYVRSASPPAQSVRTAASPTPSTLSTPSTPPPPGWTFAGPSDAQAIVFAPSDPATAYTCGTVHLDLPSAPAEVVVDVSHDFGRTWRALSLPWFSPWCDITVSPNDPSDVVVATVVCASCGPNPLVNLFRTTNGGGFWQLWPLPADGPAGGNFTDFVWAWAGSTLFLAPSFEGEQGFHYLAASIAQQPFAWVGGSSLFAHKPANAVILGLTGVGSSLFVTFGCASGCPVTATPMLRSDDGGATWTPYTPTVAGSQVYLVSLGPSGAGLFATVEQASGTLPAFTSYARSLDGGRTWQPLPAFPDAQLMAPLTLLAAPDGTAYAALWNCCGGPDLLARQGIYRLAPGAASWTYVGPFPGNPSGRIVLSWNAGGHPQALWGDAYQPGKRTAARPGLERHAP
jgi:hypothetical protein